MMKIFKIAFIPLSVLMLFSCSENKNFKGHIVYQINGQKYDENIPDEFLSSIGDKSIFYYDNGSYFQTHENSILEFGFLDSKSKQVGVKYRRNDTLFVFDATKMPTEKLIKTENKLTSKEVLGYMCNRFDVHSQNKEEGYEETIAFYYSNKIKIDGQKFTGIKYQFADEIYPTINSLPLSFEIHNPIFSVQYIATEIVKNNPTSVSELIESNKKGLIIHTMN